MTADYLWRECRSGAAFLIVTSRGTEVIGASVWRFENWTSGKKLRCLALYGRDFQEWQSAGLTLIAKIMRVGGAKSFVADGRPGWTRLFRKARLLRLTFEVELP